MRIAVDSLYGTRFLRPYDEVVEMWRSGQSYSQDLRGRVLGAIDGGTATAAVAATQRDFNRSASRTSSSTLQHPMRR